MSAAESPASRRSVVNRMVAAYGGMRRETLEILAARPSEAVLLSFMAVAGLGFFAGRAGEVLVGAGVAGPIAPEALRAEIGLTFIASFVLLPLGVYLMSLLATPLLRAAGGSGGYYETRLAVAWSAAAAFPLILLNAAIDALAARDLVSEVASFTIKIAPSALWAYLLASALAAVHSFRSARSLLGPAALVMCVVVVAVLFFRRALAF